MFILEEKQITPAVQEALDDEDIDLGSDKVYELSIRPFSRGGFSGVSQSIERMVDYLAANQEDPGVPRYIFGVIFYADLTKRWGCKVVDLSPEVRENSSAAKLLERYGREDATEREKKVANKYKADDIKLFYVAVDDLLDRGE